MPALQVFRIGGAVHVDCHPDFANSGRLLSLVKTYPLVPALLDEFMYEEGGAHGIQVEAGQEIGRAYQEEQAAYDQVQGRPRAPAFWFQALRAFL